MICEKCGQLSASVYWCDGCGATNICEDCLADYCVDCFYQCKDCFAENPCSNACDICYLHSCDGSCVGNYRTGTQVSYVGIGSENYTVTVPATMRPGDTASVSVSGTWASNRKLVVNSDETVTLVNSINANDTKVLDVTFAGIEKTGDNKEAKTYTETVAVADMPVDALFGTWSGIFNYTVEILNNGATFDDGVTLFWTDLMSGESSDVYCYGTVTNTEIADMAFYNCMSLTSITIPESVTNIGDSAFGGCFALSDITLPQNITIINNGTFFDCYSLQNVEIPQSITKIGDYAFACSGLTNIYYAGTMAQWNAIEFGIDWNETCEEITVTCTDGTIIIPAY